MTNFRKNIERSAGPKKAYLVRNWHKYDQALVARGNVFLWFQDDALTRTWLAEKNERRGAQPLYTDTAIQTMLTLKAVFNLTNRSVEGFVCALFARLGHALSVPDHTLLSHRAKILSVQIPRRARGALGPEQALHLLVDSTGLKVFGGVSGKCANMARTNAAYGARYILELMH